jgi:hypothetical protein
MLATLLMTESMAFGQCAMCRTALEQSEEGKAMAGSFRYGILLLLAAPYVIGATVGIALFRAYRKKAARSREPLLYGVPNRNSGSRT